MILELKMLDQDPIIALTMITIVRTGMIFHSVPLMIVQNVGMLISILNGRIPLLDTSSGLR